MWLSVLILVLTLPVSALATTVNTTRPESAKNSNHGITRFDEKESLNTVIVDNGDGTKTMTLYDYPVKYIDESGTVQDISLELEKNDKGEFKTKANDIKTVFPQKISNGISISKESVNIKLTPSMPLVHKWDDTSKRIIQSTVDSAVERINNETVSYYYDNNTSIEYSLTYLGFKEDIVVSKYTGQTEYTFILETNGLKLNNINGSYYLVENSGEIKATLGDIIILTADDKNNTVGYMTHTTVKENQLYILTIHIDAEWLQDEKTAYPIRIDPTVELTATGTSAIEDVTINSNGSSNGYETQLYIGKREGYGISRVLMSFPGLNLSDILSPLHIISADVHLYDPIQERAAIMLPYITPSWQPSGNLFKLSVLLRSIVLNMLTDML